MRLRYALLSMAMILFSFATATAQPFTIKGKVMDTLNQAPLVNASVTLLHADDSVMETFTRVKQDGTFTLKANKEGKYILMYVFPGFVDFIDKIELKDNAEVNLGEVPMTTRANLMKEFVLTDQFATPPIMAAP